MNWSRSWSKFCDSDRIIPNPSPSASGPWCWVGRSVMFLFDCWLAGRFGVVTSPFFCLIQKLKRSSVGKSQRLKTLAIISLSPAGLSLLSLSSSSLSLSLSPSSREWWWWWWLQPIGGGDQISSLSYSLVPYLFRSHLPCLCSRSRSRLR
ncbi:hypothetical protein F2Q68_00041347 [Brassica cretica]|uniref:Uncharacterized protein n=1 Tax=Brassica cretica TaxID=69181 RepID=A0A8S9MNB6_BRACR|nr:hypothetical protein F2Q68_00041347 [Brassica cretica]